MDIKIKLYDTSEKKVRDFVPLNDKEVDIYTKIILKYDNAIATANVDLGAKKEGELIISGTRGYIYVPAPWWKTEYFEVRFEHSKDNKKYYYQFEEDGLRYEVAEFLNSILNGTPNVSLSEDESISIVDIIEQFKKQTTR